MDLTFSRRLALLAGVVLPLLETWRRWDEMPGPWYTWGHWLDDYAIGACLLIASVVSFRRPQSGGVSLAAAWGFALGIGCLSLFGQIEMWAAPDAAGDPSGIAHGWMIVIKAAMITLGLLGLAGAMRRSQVSA